MANGYKTGGRKAGSLNKSTKEVKEIAGKFGPDAIARLAHLMMHAESEQAQVSAAKELLDRAYGKAPQSIESDISGTLHMIGDTVDKPPSETREEWIARRARELGVGSAVGAAARTTNGRHHS